MTAAEYRAHVGATPVKTSEKRSPRPPEVAPTPIPPAPPPEAATVTKRRFHYQAASGLHAEQFPDRFKIVITGPIEEQSAVEAVLHTLKHG